MKKLIRRKRITAVLLAVCLLMCCTTVAAETDAKSEPKQVTTTGSAAFLKAEDLPVNIQRLLPEGKENYSVYLQASELKDGVYDDAELYTLRTENPATGEGVLTVHSAPIKYIDEKGDLQYIDTSLHQIKENRAGYSYRNAANSFTVEYGTNATTGINFDNVFTFAVKEKAITKNAQTVSQMARDTVFYENAFGTHTSVEYINVENGIKENIILDEYTGQNKFEFVFRSETHIPILADNGTFIWIANKNTPKEPEYRFLSLYAYDSYDPAAHGTIKGSTFRHMNEELYYELTSNADGSYTVTIGVPDEYLTHPEVVYPVTIDPSIVQVSSNSNAEDTFVNEATPTAKNNWNLDYIRFGKVNGYKNFGYHRFTTLPSLPNGANITSAKLKFTFRSGQNTPASSTGVKIGVLQVESKQWYESTITWANQPYGTSGPLVNIVYNGSYLNYFNADITDMFCDWYGVVSANCGVDFTYNNEEYNDYNSVVSSEGDASRAPKLTINYTVYGSTSGIIDGQTYYIRNLYSRMYLEADSSLNSAVVQNAFHGNSNQQWKVVYQGNGLYKLYNQFAGYIGDKCCLDLASKYDDAIDVYYDTEYDWVLFNLIPNGDGSIRIQNYWPKGDDVVAVKNTSALSAVCNTQWTGSSEQKWVFELATDKLSGIRTFSAFDVGDSASQEATVVASWMSDFGYKNVGVYDSQQHSVPAQVVKDVGLYSDIVYINGHGEEYANMRVQNQDNDIVGYVCADDTIVPTSYFTQEDVPTVGIGAQWKVGSTTKTNSYWNKKTKWGILAQCSQLNHDSDGQGGFWNGLNAADVWARTMLGDGVRVHGYLGYYGTAPGEEVHLDRLNTFFEATQPGTDEPLVQAWKYSHTKLIGSSDWAVLYHLSAITDRFNFFNPEPAESSEDPIYWLGRRSSQGVLSRTVNTQFNVLLDAQVSTVSGSEKTPLLVNSSANSSVNRQAYKSIEKALGGNSNSSLTVDQKGKITYSNWNVDLDVEDLQYTITDEEAVAMAEKKLLELDLLPQGEYRTSVSATQRMKFNSDGTGFLDPEIIEYSVSFYRTYNGIDLISDEEDGILITFNKYGISRLTYFWRNIEAVENDSKMLMKPITEMQAKAIFNEKSKMNCADPVVSVAYLQRDDIVNPVWVFSSDTGYANSVFIDMYTGEVLEGFC